MLLFTLFGEQRTCRARTTRPKEQQGFSADTTPLPANTHDLYCASANSHGKLAKDEADAAPKPRKTSRIHNAQQTRLATTILSMAGASVYLNRRVCDFELGWDQRLVVIRRFGIVTDDSYLCGKDAVADTPDMQIRHTISRVPFD